MEFSVKEVMSVSCAVQRINGGFVKKEIGMTDSKANSAFLYEHFCEGKLVPVTEADQVEADEVINYLQGLGFKALERPLTDFERKVLALVTAPSVDKSTLGIAASLPNVYQNKLKSDEWTDRERELGATSDYVGKENTRCTFEATVEFLKYVPSTMSWLVTTSVDNKHILKFFMPEANYKKLHVGSTYTLAGYVKPHSQNKYTGFKETMINRVKIDANS